MADDGPQRAYFLEQAVIFLAPDKSDHAAGRRLAAMVRAAALALALMPGMAGAPAQAATAVRFLLDRPIDAMAAPLIAAGSEGFAAEDVSVAIASVPANDNRDIFARLASGDADMALTDINALIRYRDRPDAAPIKAVYVMTNAAGYAIIARRSRDISALSDFAGKTVGVVENEIATELWPALARLNGLADGKVRLQRIGAAIREPMLSAGQLDAVTGLSSLAAVNLKDRGIPASDLVVFRYADYGIAAYGLAVVVSPAFAAKQPEAVRGVLRAFNAALRATVADSAATIPGVLARMNGGHRDLELARLRGIVRDEILSEEVRRNGLGGIEPSRFAIAVDQLAEGLRLRAKPAPADIFDASYLPPAETRRLD